MLNQLNKSKEKRWPSSLNTFSIWLSYTKNNAPYTRRQKHCFDVVSLLNVFKNDVVENDQQRKKKKTEAEIKWKHAVMTHPNTMIQQYKYGKTKKFKRNNAGTRVHLLNWVWFVVRYRVGLHDDWRSFGFFFIQLFCQAFNSRLLRWKKITWKNGLVNKQDLHKSELQDSQKVFMRSYAIKLWVWQCEWNNVLNFDLISSYQWFFLVCASFYDWFNSLLFLFSAEIMTQTIN